MIHMNGSFKLFLVYFHWIVSYYFNISAIDNILPLEQPADHHYAEIRSYLEKKGTPIRTNDLLIAAQAKANDLTVVTANFNEFNRVRLNGRPLDLILTAVSLNLKSLRLKFLWLMWGSIFLGILIGTFSLVTENDGGLSLFSG